MPQIREKYESRQRKINAARVNVVSDGLVFSGDFEVKKAYLETIALVERLHRECLEVIRADLDRQGIRDLNNVQALILFNIGADELTVGELTNRGYYLGSNVSYNVKKMVENGYLIQERSLHDRRAVNVRLSQKGLDVCERMHAMFERHALQLSGGVITIEELHGANILLRRIERFWANSIDYSTRLNEEPVPTTTVA
jgi:DNA-binding MarR family transcriptional regulator